MAIRVGRWDCPSCGLKGNLGPELHCANCGYTRDKSVKFYLPDNAEIVTDADKIRAAKAGADWHCDHCGSDNRATQNVCATCGNGRDGNDKQRQEKEFGLDEQPKTGEDAAQRLKQETEAEKQKKYEEASQKQIPPNPAANDSKNATPPPKTPPPNPTQTVRQRFKNFWTQYVAALKSRSPKAIAYTFLSTVGLALFLWLAFWPIEKEVEVTGHCWKLECYLEEGKWEHDSGWNLPSGARNVTSSEKIHHYDKVEDGTETKTRDVQVAVGSREYVCGTVDKGNGYFEDKYCTETIYETRTETYTETKYKDVPVYQTYYDYEIFVWRKVKSRATEGDDKFPYEPEFTEADKNGSPHDFRVRRVGEDYWLRLKSASRDNLKDGVDQEFWQKVPIGRKLVGRFTRWGYFYGVVEDLDRKPR